MNTSYEKLSFYNSYFGGTIEGDNILSSDFYGNKTLVGVTIKKYQDTLDLLNTYYNKLVELGVIEKEKTPEEVAKEQQEMIKTMMLQMQHMQEKIDSLNEQNQNVRKDIQNDGYKQNSEHNNEQNEHELDTTTNVESINRKSESDVEFSKQSNWVIK